MWREALAGGASCKAARPAWGAEGSFACLTANVPGVEEMF